MSKFWEYACNFSEVPRTTFTDAIPLSEPEDWKSLIWGQFNPTMDWTVDPNEVRFMYLLFIDLFLDSEASEALAALGARS